MGISQRLCGVRDRVFGGSQKAMAEAWTMHESTLSRWLNRRRVPDPTWYDFLAAKLEEDISEVHRLCQIDRLNGGARQGGDDSSH
jgi:hypothetical protein